MGPNVLEFLTTEEIPYFGTQKRDSQRSIFPRIFRRILDLLGSDQIPVYKEFQAVFVPPVTNFVFNYEEGLLMPPLRAEVAESLTGLKAALKIIATDSPSIEGKWALVPRSRRFTISGSSNHVDSVGAAEHDGIWNHQNNPTVFVNTMLDSLLARANISPEERLHLLLKGFAIAIHELGHLIHRYLHHPATKDTETLHASVFSSRPFERGEGGECVEETAFGGIFDIDLTPHTPHGFRLVGNRRKSKLLVVGVDERVAKVIAMLTSPAAIQPPGPPLRPFPCFSFPHHVIALNGPKYREIFSEVSDGSDQQPANHQ